MNSLAAEALTASAPYFPGNSMGKKMPDTTSRDDDPN
jgi:hypothetical protein